MSFDPVPWAIGGGAEHSPEVGRLLAYAATNGAEGVIAPTDLKVLALATPGGSVRALPGAAMILNRSTGGAMQTYIGRNITETLQSIAATTSAAGRSELIIARVEDPNMAGESWGVPASRKEGPYIFLRSITVPAGTKRLQDIPSYSGNSAVTLARIDIPASTATITQAMITDLRVLPRPRRQREMFTVQNGDLNQNLTETGFVPFPSASAGTIAIPSWATRAYVTATLQGPRVSGSAVAGNLQVRLGDQATSSTSYNEQTAGDTRRNWTMSGPVPIPSAMRGTTQSLRVYGRKTGGGGSLLADKEVQTMFDVEFVEVIE